MAPTASSPVEETTKLSPDSILINPRFEAKPRLFIHARGSDAAANHPLLEPGTLLGGREIGTAASCGYTRLQVSRLPKITVLATGDELVPVSQSPEPHQIRQSNAHAIRCSLERNGYPPDQVGTLRDDPESSAATLRHALANSDWIILTGAISKGAAISSPPCSTPSAARKSSTASPNVPANPPDPGKAPAAQMIAALPGNPVSALTGLHAFVLPALAKAAGANLPPSPLVIPEGRISPHPQNTIHLPVKLNSANRAQPAPTGNSGDFIGLLASSGFITIPPSAPAAGAFPYTPWT